MLAYSVRRAVGALVVLLIVIWLLMFGLYHILPGPLPRPEHVPPGGRIVGDFLVPLEQQRAQNWNVAAFELGAGLLALLGLGALWRIRKRSTP